jgi:hypothetical protein
MKVLPLFSMVSVLLLAGPACAGSAPGPGYVMENEPSGEPYDWTKTGQPEKPWRRPYHKIITTKLALCDRKPDGSVGHIRFTFEQTLEVIRKFDLITAGIPKVIYIVGWQFNGHDSKYPSWAEVNVHLKRSQDPDAVTSLRWLMKKASEKYNTHVSLHINMLDAYPDSPLWDTYVKNDIICKNPDGTIRWSREWEGMKCACISYYQEWKLGYAQKRIDDLVAMLPELKETGSIHIDAFQAYDSKNPKVSDVLKHTLDDEVKTMRKIYRYFRDRHGIDVTAETFTQKRVYRKQVDGKTVTDAESFAGLQPFCWLFTIGRGEKAKDLNESYPPQIYTRTLIPLAGAFNKIKEGCGDQPTAWEAVKYFFFTWTVPDYLRFQEMAAGAAYTPKNLGDGYCLPIGWRTDNAVAVYCAGNPEKLEDGRLGWKWKLPDTWKGITKATVFSFNPNGEGWDQKETIPIQDGTVSLAIKKGDGFVLKPAQ